jgi:hypothetical protein
MAKPQNTPDNNEESIVSRLAEQDYGICMPNARKGKQMENEDAKDDRERWYLILSASMASILTKRINKGCDVHPLDEIWVKSG